MRQRKDYSNTKVKIRNLLTNVSLEDLNKQILTKAILL